MKNNKPLILKIPEGLVKKANQQGILNEVIFWYKLKSINIEGKLEKNKLFYFLSQEFNLSFSAVWKNFNKLLKLNCIIEYKDYYQIIKYDEFFSIIGFGIRDKFSYGFINGYNEIIKIKIFKIINTDLKHFLEYIIYEEIKLNFQRQAYQILQKIKQNKEFLLQSIPKKTLNEIKLNNINSFNLINYYLIDQNKNEKFWIKENDYDITISCFGLSKLLGYTSSQTGFAFLRKLRDLNLIFIKTRKILIEINDYFAKILYEKYKKISSKYVLEQGRLYYYNTNKIILN